MANTPPLTGRSSRNLQYPGFPFPPRQAMNMGPISDVDYSSQLMGQDRSGNLGAYRHQLETYDPLKDSRYQVVGRPASIPAGNGEGSLLAQVRDDETPYLRLIDAIKKRDTVTIQSLLNQGLDINYKMLDGNTPVDVAKAGGMDLRYLQKYSPDALGRSYLQKSSEQQMPSYQPPPYQPQARAQSLQFPLDHPVPASLLPSPVLSDFVMMGAGLNQFSHLQDRYSVPPVPYSYELSKEMSRRALSMSDALSTAKHMMPTQYGPPVHPISKSYADSQLYLSGLPTYDKRREMGTASGRSKQLESLPIENYPAYNSSPRPNPYANHSQYHSAMTNSMSVQKADHADSKKLHMPSSHTKVQNQAEGAIIDLTDSNSPDVVVNSGLIPKEYKSRSEPPPLLHTSSMKNKESYRPPKSYGDSRVPEVNPANSYPPCLPGADYRALHSMGAGYGLSAPAYAPGMAEPNPFHYDHLSRSHSAKGLTDSASQKIGSPWPPSRYFTPSPHHYISLEPRNKNDSPSLGVKSKMLSQPSSDLSFNYPEGSKMEHLQASKKFPTGNDSGSLDAFAMNRMRPWQYKDDSKLSPYENHLLDSARGIKTTYSGTMPTYSPYKKHEESTSWQRSILDLKRPSSAHYSKSIGMVPTQRKVPPVQQPTVNGTAEVPRNSVIQSAPKYIENSECAADTPLELTSPKKERDSPPASNDVKESCLEDNNETTEAQAAPESKPVVARELSTETREGEPSHPTLQEQVTEENDSGRQPEDSPVSGTRKRKLSVTKDPGTLKKMCPNEPEGKMPENDAEAETEKPTESISEPPAEEVQAEGKTVKRPRRSGDMDEYLYDWVMSSDDDTVNDDSSDEDYSCPTKITGMRGAKSSFSVKPRTTRRMSSIRRSAVQRTDEEGWTSDSADKAEPVLKRRRRKTLGRVNLEKTEEFEKEVRLKRSGRKKKVKKSKETQIADDEVGDTISPSSEDPTHPVQKDVPVFDEGIPSVPTVSTTQLEISSADHAESKATSEKVPVSAATLAEPKAPSEKVPVSAATPAEPKAPSEKVPVSAATPTISPQSTSVDKKNNEQNKEPEKQVRKKRKYVRKLDKNGLPIKRMRRSKNVPNNQEVKKKRKYRKRIHKNEIKNQDHVSVKNKIENLEQNLQESSIPATLAALITKSPKGPTQSPVKDDMKKTSPTKIKEQKTITPAKNVVTRGTESKDSPDEDTGAGSARQVHESPTRRSKSRDSVDDKKAKVPSAAASELVSAASQDPPVKIKKKPGRKPGWRKYPEGNTNAKPATTEVKKVKKSKKPKGDGLPRFGQRKRGRGRRKIIKSNALIPVSGDESQKQGSEKTSKESKSLARQVIKAEAEKRAGRQCFRNKRLDNENFLHVDCLELGADQRTKKEKKWKRKMSKNESSAPKSLGDVNNITEELQSQEYDYVFDYELSLYNNDEQPCTSQAATESISHKEALSVPASPLSHCQSRPVTPMGLASSSSSSSYQSPLPQNFKKLWCNSAIGETQLHKAARHGYMDNLMYYLERGSNVNQADNAGYSALHEACVHNHLEAAMLLIQYGADVNKNADGGTRPLHDAVEYDHLEMVRLMLACGADPMLSKFSGRAIPNMIHSKKMGDFIHAYLSEIKDDMCEDKELKWKLPCSEVFDKPVAHGFNILDHAPETEVGEPTIEFELFEEPPITTYLLEPEHEEAERANFYLLDDFLKTLEKTDKKKQANIRVQMISVEKFRKQIYESWLHRPFSEEIMDGRDEFVEIVSASKQLEEALETETVSIGRCQHSTSRKNIAATETGEMKSLVERNDTDKRLPATTHPEDIANALPQSEAASSSTNCVNNSGTESIQSNPCDNHCHKQNSTGPNRNRRKSQSTETDSKGKTHKKPFSSTEHCHQDESAGFQENGECSSLPASETEAPDRLSVKKAVKS